MDTGPLIWVIEDSPLTTPTVAEALALAGFRVRAASAISEALAGMQKDPPEVILLDLALPGIDGVTAAQFLKADPDLRAVPLILVSGLSLAELRFKMVECGAVDAIRKPVKVGDLVHLMRYWAAPDLIREMIAAN